MLTVAGFDVGSLESAGTEYSLWRANRLRDNRAVFLKVPVQDRPERKVLARLTHEYELTNTLSSERVVHALESFASRAMNVLVLEDLGGHSLANMYKSGTVQPGELPLPRFLCIAKAMAAAVGDIHRFGLIHKDIKPASIVLSAADEVWLTNFGLAVELSHHDAQQIAPAKLEGTLSYLAPEQTGRMNRQVDRRSDLYALGVTMYELLTGLLPFRTTDPLKLVHQHIAVRPDPPGNHRADLPEVVADIVVKLLEKNPENRYQTASGLERDLDRCLAGCEAGHLGTFSLGTDDVSDEFRVPQALFGREREIDLLHHAMHRVAGSALEFVRIHGPSGIGKSVLVGELRRESATVSAQLVVGKFDQYNRDLPYLGFLRAFAQLARQLLTESEGNLAVWRSELVDALAPNGRLLTDLVPEFIEILGDQPDIPTLGLAESQVRFNLMIRRFMRALATAEHPLVLFLDDMQWADGASIGLLQTLLTDPTLSHVLLVTAHRDNEIDATHPFLMLVEELETTRQIAGTNLAVGPLSADALTCLLAEALHVEVKAVAQLTEIVFAKTGGNPFFVHEFLRSLYVAGQIHFDSKTASWNWDEEKIRRQKTTANVVELVIERIRSLPQDTQSVLQLAAVVGHRFDLATLTRVSKRSTRQTAALIRPAIAADILVPLDGDFKYSELMDATKGNGYAFLHDRVHQAAYTMIEDAARPALHHRVGRLLLDEDGSPQEDRLFDTVNHLDAAIPVIVDASESRWLAALNLQAARKANLSMAWQAARRYSQTGRELLGLNAWVEDKQLTWDLTFESLRTAFLLSDHDGIEPLNAELVDNGASEHEKALATEIKIRFLVSNMSYEDALDVAVPLLARLGVKLPRHGSNAKLVRELLLTKWALRGRDVAKLLELPEATNPGVQVAMRIIVTVSAAAYATDPKLFAQLVFVLVRMSLRHGNTPESAFGYVCYGLAMCNVLGDYDGGLTFGELALGMIDRLSARELEPRVRFLYGLFIQVWSSTLGETLTHFREGASRGLATGDLEYYSYNLWGLDAHRLRMGEDLTQLADASAAHHEAIIGHNQEKVALSLLALRDIIAWLRVEQPIVVGDLDEAKVLALCESRHDQTSTGYCQTFRCMRQALDGNWTDAIAAAVQARKVQEGLDGQIFVPTFQFYESLALLALGRKNKGKSTWRVRSNQRSLKAFAVRVPETFAARYEMIEGERARNAGRIGAALTHYERAISYAASAENQHDRALAHQLTGECLAEADMNETGRQHLLEAAWGWDKWGATRLSQRLYQRHQLVRLASSTSHSESPWNGTQVDDLDIQSITRGARALAEKLNLGDIVDELLSLSLSSAGASRGVLILLQGDDSFAARATADVENGVRLVDPIPLDETTGVAHSVIQYTLRTRVPLLIDDVSLEHIFGADQHLTETRPRSVLCMPILRHARVAGALYLENRLVAGAFTPARVEFLTVLAEQAAISIENASLYHDLQTSLDSQIALTDAHARFVPHQFLASLGRKDIREVELGDYVDKELSVLFADIREFTPLIESLTARESIQFINAYLAHMERPILENRGFIDSYIGDAIMALFDGDADDAVAAGIGMLHALADFNQERTRRGEPPLRTGVGVNTGSLMLGTIGGRNNIKCGVIGDSVNLAARIESLTKQIGVPFIISSHTVVRLVAPERFLIRPVDRVRVVGLQEAVTLYEVFDADSASLRDIKEFTLPRYLAATKAYYAQRWEEAADALSWCIEQSPDDHIVRIMLARVEQLSQNVPGENWDGVIKMDIK